MLLDLRIPVVIGGVGPFAAGDVALAIPAEQGGHVAGCGCCAGRGGAALALGRLFLARARSETPWFTRVVATCADPATEAALRDALAHDPVASARFRLAA